MRALILTLSLLPLAALVAGVLGTILLPPIGHARMAKFCTEAAADIVGLPEPHLFDLRTFEAVVARFGRRIQ